MKKSRALIALLTFRVHSLMSRTGLLFYFSVQYRIITLLVIGLYVISPVTFAQTQLWGMTSSGGQYDAGSFFNADNSGSSLSLQHNLFQYEGAKPLFTNLMQASDGKLYGMTYRGGVNDLGILFQYDPVANTYTKKLDFDGAIHGSKPFGSLIQATDGMLYGMTYKGGIYDLGVLFQYNPVTNTFIKKFDFDGTANGRNPHHSLIEANDGNLYGMTVQGGSNDMGVIFQYNPISSIYTKKMDFDSIATGSNPVGNLIQASDHLFYGMAAEGGVNNFGVLFQYDPATNIFTKKLDFDGAIHGGTPLGNLVQASDGNLYSMTSGGGANGFGVLFQYDPVANIYTKKFDFDGTTNGRNPYGSLLFATDGTIYGMTTIGGLYDMGTMFQYHITTSSYVKKLDFSGTIDGSTPYSTLMQASNGMIYGLTNLGGTNDVGVLFQYDPSSANYTKKFDFGAPDGKFPNGSLMQATDHLLYGMTNEGGLNNNGVLFQYDPTIQSYVKNITFDGATNGRNPYGSLIQANDGMLYGMTSAGGTNDSGLIFQYNPTTHILTPKVNFTGPTKGINPHGSLMQANDGMLYGMTYRGGTNDFGVLFQYNPISNTYAKMFDFDGAINGRNPYGSLIQASDGNIYGMTYGGGVNDLGVLFQYDPISQIYTKKFDFDGTISGSNPYGSLIQANNGNLYGMTYSGGTNNIGVLFQYNSSTNTLTKNLDFDGITNGSNPYGSLIQASNGNLYGMTYSGGANDMGVQFQYNPVTNVYTKKFDFDGRLNGSHPYADLLEINLSTNNIPQLSLIPQSDIFIYPNPAKNTLAITNIISLTMIRLYDTCGKLVIEKETEENITLDISLLPQGFYTLAAESTTNKTYRKVVIIK